MSARSTDGRMSAVNDTRSQLTRRKTRRAVGKGGRERDGVGMKCDLTGPVACRRPFFAGARSNFQQQSRAVEREKRGRCSCAICPTTRRESERDRHDEARAGLSWA